MYIIGEYLFLENLMMNYLILYITKIITRTTVNKHRILLIAIIAAFYPFAIFFPSFKFLNKFYMKLIISIIIIKLAFNAKSLGLFLKQLSGFYVISFVFAGASIGFYYFTNNYNGTLSNSLIYGFPFKYLILGVIIGKIMIKNILRYYNEKVAREQELIRVNVYLDNRSSSFIALKDTGNSLIEPVSKLPVLVVEYEFIKELLPEDLIQLYDSQNMDFKILEDVIEKINSRINIRLIPFKSIGSNNGILLGFKPDYIAISDKSEVHTFNDLIIGIFNNKLSSDNQYNGLLNMDILQGGNLYVKEN